GISEEVTNLSTQLREAQARAEAVAQGVSRQAELFNSRRNERNEKLEEFRVLGEKVRELTAAIGRFRPARGDRLTNEDRARLTSTSPVSRRKWPALLEGYKICRSLRGIHA